MKKINNKINKIYKREEVNNKFNKFLTKNRSKNLAIDIYRLNMNEIYDKYSLNYLKKYGKSESKIKEFIKNKLKENKIIPDYTGIAPKNNPIKIKISYYTLPLYLILFFYISLYNRLPMEITILRITCQNHISI